MPDDGKIRISREETEDGGVDEELQRQGRTVAAPSAPRTPGVSGDSSRKYGRIGRTATVSSSREFLYSAVMYTTVAGLVAALIAWVISEYAVQEVLRQHSSISATVQAAVFFAVVGAVLGAGLCSVEGIVSRNLDNAFSSGLLGLLLGFGGGAIAGAFGQAVYAGGMAKKQYVVMALDISGSMEGQPLSELKSSSRQFVNTANERTSAIGVVTFSTGADVVSELSGDTDFILRRIDQFEAFGETNMAAGVQRARRMLESKQGRRVLLVFSDGMPNLAAGIDIPRLVKAELQRRGMNEVEVIQEQLSKAGLTLADLEQMPEEQRNEVLGMTLLRFLDESGIMEKVCEEAEAATLHEARESREAGIELIAIGTGEANRAFLRKITGKRGTVLFAASGELSKAFEAAQNLLFRESPANMRLTAPSVILRALSWAFVGALLASGQGIATRSAKKVRNGAIGGFLGGLLGGLLFDPLSLWLRSGAGSRFAAICVIGVATGGLLGLVENVLKDAWLKVISGQLAGKQFVIYKDTTILGSSPKSDIYLFKDATVEPQHAAIRRVGNRYDIEDLGSRDGTVVNNSCVTHQRLRAGDVIRIGHTVFRYSEKKGGH